MKEINLSNPNYDYSNGVYGEGSYTQESLNKLGSTASSFNNSFQQSFSVQTVNTDNFWSDALNLAVDTDAAKAAYRDALGVTAALGAAGANLTAWDPTQYGQAADAASAAALDYLQEKLDRILKLVTNTTDVTVGALLQEVAPFAMSPSKAVSAVTNRLSHLVGYLTGTGSGEDSLLGQLNDLAKDAATSVLSNENLVNSIANINAIQGVAASLEAINKSWIAASNILKAVEPLLPGIEICAAWSGVWTNPVLATEASEKSINYGQKLLDWALSKAFILIKKYIFGITITVPEIVLGAADTISVKDAVSEWEWGDSGSTWRNLADAATNGGNYSSDYNSVWVQSSQNWVNNTKWNTNNWNGTDLASLGIPSEDYARIIGNSIDSIVRTSQSSLRIDEISAEAYRQFNAGKVSLWGAFGDAWDESNGPAGWSNLKNAFTKNSPPDSRLMLSATTQKKALHLANLTGGYIE